jgi:DNA (cytosine-5)-methyltransferase 1
MDYFSICDGIGASHCGLLPIGYRCVGVSEIDKFCNQLIETKYDFRNYGDFTKWKTWGKIKTDLVIGGTPCQSFSTSGKRAGAQSTNGSLTFEFVNFICTHRPKYFLWENVAAVLFADKGRLFAGMLAKFSQFGYGLAWKILNCRHFGVPQHRRRLFLVGCFGSATGAGEILFETETMPVPFEASHETGQDNSTAVTIDDYTNGKQSRMERRYRNNYPFMGTLATQIDAGAEQIDRLVIDSNRIRYLTPLECERLQGFPDGYTLGFSDTQRYKMLGNSMPVPVIRWIGQRILAIDSRSTALAKAAA